MKINLYKQILIQKFIFIGQDLSSRQHSEISKGKRVLQAQLLKKSLFTNENETSALFATR